MGKGNAGLILVSIGGIVYALNFLDSPWDLIVSIPLVLICLVSMRSYLFAKGIRGGYRWGTSNIGRLALGIGGIVCAVKFLDLPWNLVAIIPLAIICIFSARSYARAAQVRKATGNRMGNVWRLLFGIGGIVCALKFLDSPWNQIVTIPFAIITLILLFSNEKNATRKAKGTQYAGGIPNSTEKERKDAERVARRARRKQKKSASPEKTHQTEIEYAKVLGLEGKVTPNEIKKKYLELIKQNHPDKVRSMSDEIREVAERKSKEINKAYEYFREKYGF
ncbi:MAG: J domain-containing protein [Opitutales bacterium]